MAELTVEELERNHKALMQRRSSLESSKARVEGELQARKKALKEAMEECKKEGFNPDTLPQDIQHLRTVVSVKMETFAADLAAAEDMIKPLLKEVG